jgi:hypothetical protein
MSFIGSNLEVEIEVENFKNENFLLKLKKNKSVVNVSTRRNQLIG